MITSTLVDKKDDKESGEARARCEKENWRNQESHIWMLKESNQQEQDEKSK